MKFTLQHFHQLGIYRRLSTFEIINIMMCNRAMSFKPLVAQAPALYKYSRKFFTPMLTEFIIKNTFCKALTAGTTLQQANQISNHFRKDNISIILDFCAEGEKDSTDNQILNDENAKLFAKSAATLSLYKNQMTSIKITGLIKMPLLMRLNEAVILRDNFWKQNSESGIITGKQILSGFKSISKRVTSQEVSNYLLEIHNYEGVLENFQIDEVGFKMNHYPYFINQQKKNENSLVQLLFPQSEADKKSLQNLKKRLTDIIDPQTANQNGFKILVDAEQSYVQKAIEIVSQQLQHKYNQKRLYILPTIQNYLKNSVQRSAYEIQIAKRRNLFFGAKLVRGAYLVQQTKLAQEKRIQNPVVDCFEDTTVNYLQSFRMMVSSFSEGEIVVATHNFNTVQSTTQIAKSLNTKVKVSYAQLLGLADHLTYKAQNEGYQVYKYLPWASTKTMIPYMIRRAQQLSQMKYPLQDQYKLLKMQLRNRFL